MRNFKNALIALLSIFLFLFESCNRNEIIEDNQPVQFSKNVYITGAENNNAYYWKNSEKIILKGGEGCYASKILINNNKVYVLGGLISEYTSLNEYNPSKFVWIDGVKHNLGELLGLPANNPNNSEYFIQGMTINKNGNVIFYGSVKNSSPTSNADVYQACYWENGKKIIIITSSDNKPFWYFDPTTDDVYISAGTFDYTALEDYRSYFKNGKFLFKDKDVNTQYFYSDDTGVNVFYKQYDDIKNSSSYKLYQKNLVTKASKVLPEIVNQNVINKFFVDGNDKYFIGDDFYIKNDVLLRFDTPNGYDKIGLLQVMDNNIYSIRYHSNNFLTKFFINNVEKQSILLTSINSGNASGFTSLYLTGK